MITSIISNNCMGGVMYHRHNMPITTPTVKLEIMPEDYAKFCTNIHHYMDVEVMEYPELSEEDKAKMIRMYDKIPETYFFGKIDDIMIAFAHYDSFECAKRLWDRRRKRIEWDNLAYVMHMHYQGRGYEKEVQEFLDLNLPHSAAFTNGFKVGNSYMYTVPDVPGIDDFGWYNGQYTIEMGSGFDEEKFLRGEL